MWSQTHSYFHERELSLEVSSESTKLEAFPDHSWICVMEAGRQQGKKQGTADLNGSRGLDAQPPCHMSHDCYSLLVQKDRNRILNDREGEYLQGCGTNSWKVMVR